MKKELLFATLAACTFMGMHAQDYSGYSLTNPVDMTSKIVNPTFDNNTDGWGYTTGAKNHGLAENKQGAFTGKFFENWNQSAFTGKIYQTLENLPNGTYELSLAAFVNTVGEEGTQYVYANNAKANLTVAGDPQLFRVATYVTDGKLEIGLEQTAASANWVGIDNAAILYFGSEDVTTQVAEGVSDEARAIAQYNGALAQAEALANREEIFAGKAELKAEIANQKTQTPTVDNMASLLASLNEKYNYASEMQKSLEGTSIVGWTNTVGGSFHVNTWSTEGETDGSNMLKPFIEAWKSKSNNLETGEINYTQLTGLEPGYYTVTGLVRAYNEANGEVNYLNLHANNVDKDVITSGVKCSNNLGYYNNFQVYTRVAEDGILELGFKTQDPNYNWIAFKNIKIVSTDATKILADYSAARQKAQDIADGNEKIGTSELESLKAALSQTINEDDLDELIAATAQLQETTNAAESSIAAYAHAKTALDNTATLLSQTNLYDSYSNYISEYEQNKAAYEDGSMTSAEASSIEDPFTKVYKNPNSKVNDFLLSAWDGVSGYTGPFYINTWSTEGESDGTNFVVPFFEYWTGDGNELNPQTMSANYVVEDPDYTYEVNAWVRLRKTNNKEGIDFSKIKFVVGDPEATVENKQTGEINYYNVATLQSLIDNGAQVEEVPVGNSTFSLLHITKESTSDLMGYLPIQFIVEEGSNASWLSWKDIKINMTDKQATGLNKTEKADATTTNGAVYNVAGQKVNGLQKGLNIQNGKKILVK